MRRAVDVGVGASAACAAFRALLRAVSVATVMAPGIAAAQQTAGQSADSSAASLPEIHVIATTPVAPPPRAKPAAAAAATAESTAAVAQPGVVDQDKIPSNVQTLSAADFSYMTTPDLLQAMERALPGVALSDQTGNQFQLDLNYRGFIASPVIGTPQGIAVYQNGVRINEVFGDIVNWDFIPQNAINGMTLVPSNPVYGLNAIGGALSIANEEWLHLPRRRRRSERRLVWAHWHVRAGGRRSRKPVRLYRRRRHR